MRCANAMISPFAHEPFGLQSKSVPCVGTLGSGSVALACVYWSSVQGLCDPQSRGDCSVGDSTSYCPAAQVPTAWHAAVLLLTEEYVEPSTQAAHTTS